jgi:prepilin-type processing-associated H-X9-DG protein
VQAARESARRTQCINQLKELTTGGLNHESAMRYYPTGGWGWSWVGDADRGFGQSQPGGWIYNILPFIEQRAKHDMPKDGKPNEHTDQQLEGARLMLIDPILIINCPTRDNGLLGPTEKKVRFAANSALNPTGSANVYVGHSDYAANAGDVAIGGGTDGPSGLVSAAMPNFPWLTINKIGLRNPPDADFTGISFQRSEVGVQHVSDGTSKTYFAGEKYLDPTLFFTDKDTGDNETWCTGHNNDNFRTTAEPPRRDTEGLENGNWFGSAHPTGWNVAWCDGHVQYMSFEIDPVVHKNNGNRQDGNIDGGP